MSYHYTALKDVKEILIARVGQKQEVEKMWADSGCAFPFQVADSRCHGVFARQLASFRFEDAMFVSMCEQSGLVPAWLPYGQDVFVSVSPLKRSYIAPLCADRYSKNGELITKRNRMVSYPNQCERKKLKDIRLVSGEMLPEWHRAQLKKAYPEAVIFDENCYEATFKNLPVEKRYDLFLTLFIAHMILFEDYHGGESGGELDCFTSRVFEPAFNRVYERFNVKPLIVPIAWRPEFAYYPDGELLTSWRQAPFLSLE